MKKNSKKLIASLILGLLILWQYLIAIYPSIVALSFWGAVQWRAIYFLLSCITVMYLSPKLSGKINSFPIIDFAIFVLMVVFLFAFEIKIPIRIEKYYSKKDYNVRIGYIIDKIDRGRSWRRGPDYYLFALINNKRGQLDVRREDYKKINVGDTVFFRVSSRGGIYINNLFPTHEEIERYKVPQHYINGELQEKPPYEQYSAAKRDSMLRMSHNQIGYVFEKTDDDYFRHLVKVGIDAEHTTTHEFYETDRNYPKVYKRLNVGDTVIMQVSDSMPEINRVLCWQPNEKEIAEYASYKAIKDYNNCSKEFEDKMLLNSHKSLAFVYDKYQDEHIGAYLEVGIDENHTRTYLFKTFEKDYEQIYKTVSIGDTVIALASDSIPQLNQVLDWHPTNYYMQIGYIFRKDSRGITKQFNTMVYVGIKKNKLWKHEMSMFKNIHEGDTILMKLSNKDSEYNEVISWHPTPEEMEKYKKPVRLIDLSDE